MQKKDTITIYGAKVHNLKNINLEIPRNKLVVFTGKSGSGKSSLAFNTIHAEGQRRYFETFNAYARQFLGEMERPDVDKINGLSPVVAIEQKTISKNPRSTVGTLTEIYDFLRLLFARVGTAHSYITGKKMISFSNNEIIDLIISNYNNKGIDILAPIVRSRKGHYQDLFRSLAKKGFLKVRVDGAIESLSHDLKLDRYKNHDIELFIDKLKVSESNRSRIESSIKTAMDEGDGMVCIIDHESESLKYFSKMLMCPDTGMSYKNPEPNTFSFNSPKGACTYCNGLGSKKIVDLKKIIPDNNLSISNGAIAPIVNKKSEWLLNQINIIGKKYNFDLHTQIRDISNEGLKAILYGIQDEFKIKLQKAGITKTYKIDFKGIIPFIEDQYEDQYSKSIKKWASKYMITEKCKKCDGSRLNIEASNFKIANKKIHEVCKMDILKFQTWIGLINKSLDKRQKIIAQDIIKEIKKRVQFIIDVGLIYLSLNRSVATLSGGEAQRIRLATQIGTQLTNVLYILDEPSIGLHQRDNLKLINSLKRLRDIGNSIIVVEHDQEMIESSDHIVDLGPEAGINGGQIIYSGNFKDLVKNKTITGQYLSGKKKIKTPSARRKGNGKEIKLVGACGNNLKNISITIPLGIICCVTGVSGSGKSTLINNTLHPILSKHFYRSEKEPLPYKELIGINNIDKVVNVDQSPIGRTPRSNPATYTAVFSEIRKLFTDTQISKQRGYSIGRFSFNVIGGRCEECKGGGKKNIEMNFLPDLLVLCDACNGRRYNKETLEVLYKGKSIYDILEMTISEATSFFKNIPSIFRKLKVLDNVGLGYVKLGQAATTLSGGEAQRIKLSAELSKKGSGNTLYILDEPTTGLHFEDIKILLNVINSIVNNGNTVLIIEHNMDIIKSADFIIDIGLEGGENGGTVICNGTPEYIVKHKKSFTGAHLKKYLSL